LTVDALALAVEKRRQEHAPRLATRDRERFRRVRKIQHDEQPLRLAAPAIRE
jgi:hypothetical protein